MIPYHIIRISYLDAITKARNPATAHAHARKIRMSQPKASFYFLKDIKSPRSTTSNQRQGKINPTRRGGVAGEKESMNGGCLSEDESPGMGIA